MTITYSEGVFVDLVIIHAKRMHRVILSPVASLAHFWLLQPLEKGSNDASLLSISRHGATSRKTRIFASILRIG
jgi:hypothetical protein